MSSLTSTFEDVFPEIRWHGHWIWVAEEQIVPTGFRGPGINPNAAEAHGLFRKRFSVPEAPPSAPARITADARYVLFVNGQEVGRGPIRGHPLRQHYDAYDLAPYLRAGDNVIAAHVRYYGRPTSFWMPAVPNLTLGRTGVLVFEASLGSDNWLVSDQTWLAQRAEAWLDDWRNPRADYPESLPLESFDARRFDPEWLGPDFDDSAWQSAQLVPAVHVGGYARTQPPTHPYGPLYPRPIAQLSGERKLPASVQVDTLRDPVDTSVGSPVDRVAATIGQPVSDTSVAILPARMSAPARLVIDMGVIVSGPVELDLEAPAGTTLDVFYVEGPLRPSASMIRMRAGMRYIARGAADHFLAFDSNGFRYAYVLVHGATEPVTLQQFAVREHVYPWQSGASFECDDPFINELFHAGIRTVQLNSHDAFLDCPTREQRAWVGDSVVHQMVHLATNADWRLAWHWLEMANSPRPDGMLPMSVAGDIEAHGAWTIPDWALHWVHGVYNRYWFSGDRGVVKALLPSVERVLRWYLPYLTRAGVLKDVAEWNLVDWSSVSNEDTSGVLTAIWARGLREFAEMAAWLEERASEAWARGIYERLRVGLEMFWDDARGSYIDHIKDGLPQPEMSQLAGALAIVSGLAPEDRWARIVETITDPDRLVVRSWMGGSEGEYSAEKRRNQLRGIYTIDWDAEREVVLAEPFMSYVVHDAVVQAGRADLLPDLFQRWSEFLRDGYDTIGECWGWGTHVHGWSCTPTRDVLFSTLGIMPAEPGFASVRIAPRLGRLQWARGRMPTPHGFVSVDVSSARLRIESPIPIELALPARTVQHLPPGTHELPLQPATG